MNKRTLTTFLLSLIFLVSCTNLDDIYNRLDDHEKRLKSLEELVTNTNTSISNLQKVIDAQAQKLSVVSYQALEDGSGYVLIMSDNSEIVLKNGTDGTSPLIGVKEYDGQLYWTINGDFMLDSDGNKIKAEGNDGSAGITPQLRVNTDGYWEVSQDGGKRWTAILDADGNPVKAVGQDATVDLTITEDEDTITIVYNGQTFTIPKHNGSTPTPIERPLLAIDYVAEYNVNAEGTGFTTSHANDMSGYFNWDDAMSLFAFDKGFTIDGQAYHLPSQDEWCGIVPTYDAGKNVRFDVAKETLGVEEHISVGGAPVISYEADYKSLGNNISYGLRYKNQTNDQLSAWRYALIDNPDGGGQLMSITVRYLGPTQTTATVNQIADESWWDSNKEEDIVRYFPLPGIERDGGEITGRGEYAMYWLSTEGKSNPKTAYNMYIYSGGAFSDYSYSGKNFGVSLRLLKNDIQSPDSPDNPGNPTNVKLPIEYMTEFNVAPDAMSFVTESKNDNSGYFTSEEALSKFTDISIAGKNYHLPKLEEWRGIINETAVGFKSGNEYADIEEEVQIGKEGELKTYLADYVTPVDNVVYGLRFREKEGDSDRLSAWRYQYTKDPNSTNEEDQTVIITVRLLGKDYQGTVDDIAKADFWDSNNSNDIVRYIPLCGWIDSYNDTQMKGSDGRYFSSTHEGNYCWYAFFTSYSAGLADTLYDWYYDVKDKYTVRLFED
ncbi:MAG: PL29 family lyase N-terminal domain-containing protein [Porphyromonas sp.]|nr:PL29 family lyase N-terminal domain-containing protein [Porphyromonas sp.]